MRKSYIQQAESQLRLYGSGAPPGEWADAIKETLDEYKNTGEPGKARLLELRYFNRMTEEQVTKRLYVSNKTYFAWKREVLFTLIAYAAKRGILK